MSIRTKLTIIMLAIGLAPTLLVGAIAYVSTSRELTDKTYNQLVSVAGNQQQKINAMLQAKQEEATKLNNQFDLQSALNTYISGDHTGGANALYQIVQNKKVDTPDIQTISVVDVDGKVITSTVTSNTGQKLAAADYYMPAGQESYATVKQDPRDGIDKLYATVKISVNKKESGFLNLIFRIDDITAAIQDYTGLGATGETVIAAKDSNGNAISLFPLRSNTDAALKTNLNSLQLFTATDNLYRQVTDYRGHTVIVTSKPIGFAGWVLATKIDTDEALGPIKQLGVSLALVMLACAAALIVASVYFTRLFTQPILRIAEVAGNFGRGDFSSRAAFKRADEVGALANAIDATGNSLQDMVTRLESQRNRLAIIINSAAESILAIDKDGTILLANEAVTELTQLPQNSIVNHSISQVFSWKQELRDFPIDYAKPGINTYPNLQYVDAAGVEHYLKLIVSQVAGEHGEQLPQTIVTIHDETKSRDLENMKVDFVSMAAHELRTPLAATRGYLELINFKEGESMPADINNYLQQALKSTAELGNLIDNLLGVTRIERGTLTLHPEKVDIAADVQQAVRNASFSANDKRIALAYDGPTSNCYVIADQISMHEVINNLINNAIKYTNSGGTVTVLLGRDGSNYAIRFKDTGIGIPKQAIANLFTKFYRVHGGLNSGSTGTGLGLFISKSIIERHGGTISVESEEGVGSTFTVTIPVLDEKRLTELKSRDTASQTIKRGNRGWTTKNIAR